MKNSSTGYVSFTVSLLVIMTASVFVSCEAVFTYSPFSSLKRDPAKMTGEQAVAFAQDALDSADPEAAKAAFDAVKTQAEKETDPEKQAELRSLAVDLGLKSAGVTDAVVDLLADLSSSADAAAADPGAASGDIVTALEKVAADMTPDNRKYAEGALEQLEALGEENASSSQYLMTAVALVVTDKELIDAIKNDPASIDTSEPDIAEIEGLVTTAARKMEAEGGSSDLLSGITGAVDIDSLIGAGI